MITIETLLIQEQLLIDWLLENYANPQFEAKNRELSIIGHKIYQLKNKPSKESKRLCAIESTHSFNLKNLR